jgi:predicted small metal-binding protein
MLFILRCQDLGMPSCPYVAKAETENEVILSMMEHAMKTHPERVKELMLTMTKEGIMEMMRKKIQREVVDNQK